MLFYIVIENNSSLCFSPVPEVDRLGSCCTKYLSPGLPLGLLEKYLERIIKHQKQFTDVLAVEREIKDLITRGLKKDGIEIPEDPEWKNVQGEPVVHDEELFGEFCRKVRGRQLAEGEIRFLAEELGIDLKQVQELMQKAVKGGLGSWIPAVKREESGWRCQRCGETNLEEWPGLYGIVRSCKSCASLGSLNSLQVLFRMGGGVLDRDKKAARQEPLDFEDKNLSRVEAWGIEDGHSRKGGPFRLTAAQLKAAADLRDYVSAGKQRQTLLWAACGAGKTEVCFPAVEYALKNRWTVLYAAPRQDVIHEVVPRLERNFPGVKLLVLSGALPLRFESGLFTAATTHQVLRFYNAFDLIVFDEMDAYPYYGSKALKWGLFQALKAGGKIIYLTATPTREILERVKQGYCKLVRLPARHHRRPLPVPEWHRISSKGLACFNTHQIKELAAVLEELAADGPLLLFVPKVSLVKDWVGVLRGIFKDKKIDGSWSSDPDRRKKIINFTRGFYDIFVATMILERGITVRGVQTVVLYADHELFDERALVQMAGRTGRSAEQPGGRVLFLAGRQTEAMKKAVNWIEEQNRIALREGLIDKLI